MEKKTMKEKAKNFIPAVALKLGEHSATQACIWWFNQPKMPTGLKKEEKNK